MKLHVTSLLKMNFSLFKGTLVIGRKTEYRSYYDFLKQKKYLISTGPKPFI